MRDTLACIFYDDRLSLMSMREERFSTIGEHIYQPKRKGNHARVLHLSTDVTNVDWNARIARDCYLPQLRQETLHHVSFDFYTTMRREMEKIAPDEVDHLKEAMRERGVGDPYLHVLLPDLSTQDKEILIHAGRTAFFEEAGVYPQWLWVPETALDLDVLMVAKRAGYVGVLCAPEQVDAGREVDNYPVVIHLPTDGEILILPFDRPFSSDLAFKDKTNADSFLQEVIIPRILSLPKSVPLIAWTDGETFGHHAPFADLFLHYLVTHSMPEAGIAMLGINDLLSVWESQDYVHGKLVERSAWSCKHGNLVRWHGACPCDSGYNGNWKGPFSEALSNLNVEVTALLDLQLSKDWPKELGEHFTQAFEYEGGVNTKMSLYAAKASILAAQTSCGAFFDSPQTSGRINMMFVRQTLEHLIDAGFTDLAFMMLKSFMQKLSFGVDPHTGKKLDELFADLLTFS